MATMAKKSAGQARSGTAEPGAARSDVAASILAYDAGGDPERLAIKYKAMRADAFVFFRGTCALFYNRLPDLGGLAEAPLAWSCGDLHLENFGSYKGDNGLVYFDINDFDEAVLAPCIWDLVRVVASIRIASASLGLKPARAGELASRVIAGYAATLSRGAVRWIESETATGIIGALLGGLKGKSRKELLAGRVEGEGRSARLITDGKHALKASGKAVRRAEALLDGVLGALPKPERFRVLDIARRIAGTGSLGVERYVVLAERRKDEQLVLLDLKQARPSSSVPHIASPQPPFQSEADRVIAIQSIMQAVTPARLASVTGENGAASYVLRVLQPQEDRFNLGILAAHEEGFEAALDMMAQLTAWAQLRAAGRFGSQTPDALMAFARSADTKPKWTKMVDRVAEEAASRAASDWKAYCKAYDAGAFASA